MAEFIEREAACSDSGDSDSMEEDESDQQFINDEEVGSSSGTESEPQEMSGGQRSHNSDQQIDFVGEFGVRSRMMFVHFTS
jgi:hypothetical protein